MMLWFFVAVYQSWYLGLCKLFVFRVVISLNSSMCFYFAIMTRLSYLFFKNLN